MIAGAILLVSTSTPSTAVDIVRASLVELTPASRGWRYPRSAKAASSAARRFGSKLRRVGIDNGSSQLPNPFERLIEPRAIATHRGGPVEHAVDVDLAADEGVRDDGIAGSRAHGDGPVFELPQRRAERDAGIGAGHATDVDAASLDPRQDAINVCLAECDHTQRDQQGAQQRAERESASGAPRSRDAQRSDHRCQRTGYGHRVLHLTETRAIPASGVGAYDTCVPARRGYYGADRPRVTRRTCRSRPSCRSGSPP